MDNYDLFQDGRCGGAALDVFIEEPPKCPTTLELIRHPRVVATPHLGASTDEAQQRVAVEIAEQFLGLAGNERFAVNGVVNAPVLAATMVPDNQPWIRLANELGRIATKMVQGEIPNTKIRVETTGKNVVRYL